NDVKLAVSVMDVKRKFMQDGSRTGSRLLRAGSARRIRYLRVTSMKSALAGGVTGLLRANGKSVRRGEDKARKDRGEYPIPESRPLRSLRRWRSRWPSCPPRMPSHRKFGRGELRQSCRRQR